MKIFGTLREIVAAVFRKNNQEITLKPNDGTYTGAVEIKLPPKLTAGAAVLVAEDVQQTLTNKILTSPTIDAANIQSSSRLDGAEVRAIGTAVGTPSLKFYENYSSGTSSIAVQAPALSSDWTFTLPNTAGTPGTKYALANTNGDGTTSWVRYDSDNIASALVQRDVSGNFSAGTITATLSGNATNVSGTVAIGNGGTGQTTQQAALTALAGTQASGQYLRSNGTNTLLSSIQAADVPTLNQNTTGTAFNITASSNSTLTTLSSLSLPGSQVSGNISGNAANVTGTVAIGNGGTGQTTANAALNALLPSQTLAANKYLKSDGTNTTWASASGGAGEINAVLNSSGADGITGWVAGTSHSTPTVITGANNPLDPIVPTAFSFTATAATAIGSQTNAIGIYDDITLPTALQNRKLKVEFSYTTPASSLGTWAVVLYQGSTKVVLTTDTGSPLDTVLPAGVTGGKFTAYFDSINASAYRLLLVQRTRTSANTLYLTNVIVGPGIQPQGAVVGEWQSYTPTVSSGTATARGYYRRVGDSMELNIFATWTVAGSGGSTMTVSTPSGFTIDSSKLARQAAASSLSQLVGNGYMYNGSTLDESGVSVNTTTTLAVFKNATGGPYVQSEFVINSQLNLVARVPIAEWAGSGTVQLAQNDVEFAASAAGGSEAGWDAAAGVGDTVYGPNGAVVSGALSTQRIKRIRFQTPSQAGDKLFVEVQRNGQWVDLAQIFPHMRQGAAEAGATILPVSGSSTDFDIYFYQYSELSGTSFGAAGASWPSSTRWRVRKSSAGAAVGFGIVQPGVSSGLVSSSGLPGNTSGLPISAGYVGQRLTAFPGSAVSFGASTINTTVTSISLPTGVWIVFGAVQGAIATGGPITAAYGSLSLTGALDLENISGQTTTIVSDFYMSIFPRYVNSSGSTTVNLIARITYGTATGTYLTTSGIVAIRIA